MTKKQNTQLTAIDVGDYFLSLMDEDAGDTMSNLYLQKLVYLAQGFHLAEYGKPLFNEPIEAREFDPVVPILFDYYKKYGPLALPKPIGLDLEIYSSDVRELLDKIHSIYGQYAAWRLQWILEEERALEEHFNIYHGIIETSDLEISFIQLLKDLTFREKTGLATYP